MMTAIDRTIYHRMKRSYTPKELIEAYTPTEEERQFVSTMTRIAQNRLTLMIWIKLFPYLGYFPALCEIPAPLIDHIRKALALAADVVPGYENDRTLYRHHQMVHEYYQILPYDKEARRVILRTQERAECTMDNPTNMINAALEELIKQRFELPAFSTLDRGSCCFSGWAFCYPIQPSLKSLACSLFHRSVCFWHHYPSACAVSY